jgi:bacterial leucyl aminopeptidase
VALVSPAAGTVSGKVTITAAATVDSNAGLVRVDLKDGDMVIGTGGAATLSVSWDTAAVPNGVHALSAAVADGAGNVATSPVVSVSVANRSGGGCSSGGASGAESFALVAVLAALKGRRSRSGTVLPGR